MKLSLIILSNLSFLNLRSLLFHWSLLRSGVRRGILVVVILHSGVPHVEPKTKYGALPHHRFKLDRSPKLTEYFLANKEPNGVVIQVTILRVLRHLIIVRAPISLTPRYLGYLKGIKNFIKMVKITLLDSLSQIFYLKVNLLLISIEPQKNIDGPLDHIINGILDERGGTLEKPSFVRYDYLGHVIRLVLLKIVYQIYLYPTVVF